MKKFVGWSIALALVGLPVAPAAQVTQSYGYDGDGRLTGITTVGSGGTNTAAYAYDDANNRTSRTQIGTNVWAAILSLPVNEPLLPTHALVSSDGRYSLALRVSGNLELWETLTDTTPVSFADDFRIDASGAAIFRPASSAEKAEGSYLTLSDDGELLVMAADGAAVLWHPVSARASEAVR